MRLSSKCLWDAYEELKIWVDRPVDIRPEIALMHVEDIEVVDECLKTLPACETTIIIKNF